MSTAFAFVLALLVGAAQASEARVTHADLAEIRDVIQRQIELVSPGVQPSFGTPERTSLFSTLWLADFSMQCQRDGSWRSEGCHLVQPGRSISA